MVPPLPKTPSQQYYVFNKQPTVNYFLPTPAVISDQDILAMPTVIVSDERKSIPTSELLFVISTTIRS